MVSRRGFMSAIGAGYSSLSANSRTALKKSDNSTEGYEQGTETPTQDKCRVGENHVRFCLTGEQDIEKYDWWEDEQLLGHVDTRMQYQKLTELDEGDAEYIADVRIYSPLVFCEEPTEEQFATYTGEEGTLQFARFDNERPEENIYSFEKTFYDEIRDTSNNIYDVLNNGNPDNLPLDAYGLDNADLSPFDDKEVVPGAHQISVVGRNGGKVAYWVSGENLGDEDVPKQRRLRNWSSILSVPLPE